MKLWGGRFSNQTDKLVEHFNASIGFDQELYHYDIEGSKVHVRMLARCGIISSEEAEILVKGLSEVEKDIEEGRVEFSESLEDIHTLVEVQLTEKVGKVGGKLHIARSRNDQVALDMRLYMRDKINMLQNELLRLMQGLLDLAADHKDTIMPGYTHLQKAQPVTLGHHLLAYYFKFKRDYERLEDNLKRVNIYPLGSGALAGTSFPIDREWAAEELGFTSISLNSMDGVSDRDFLLEFLSVAATIMMHLSRFSEELIIWSSDEFSFIEIGDAFTTGSSIMPQKKNPDVAELTRGKTGRVYGHLMQLLTVLKGIPMAYNKDLQEDKEGIFDTVQTLEVILKLFPDMLKSVKVNKEKMYSAAGEGYINATELANYLVRKGLTFREAHEIVGKAVIFALDKKINLEEISLEDWHKLFPVQKDVFTDELYSMLQIDNIIKNTSSRGGPDPEETAKIIEEESNWLSLNQKGVEKFE